MTTTPIITPAQQKTIDSRQRDIRRLLHDRFSSWAYNRVREDNRNTVGGQMDNRQVSFAKIAIFSNGSYLLSHWGTIEPEILMDPLYHAYQMRGEASGVRGSLLMAWGQADLQNRFYQTLKTGEIVDAFGGWSCERVDALPNFGAVSRDDVWEWLGYMGGSEGP